jgi:hypothetical protein
LNDGGVDLTLQLLRGELRGLLQEWAALEDEMDQVFSFQQLS